MTIYIEDMFDYNPETGWFTNRYSRGRAKIGERAGASTGHGYRRIIIDYTKHYEHHLAWYYVHGIYPDEIDHINGDRSDNRIANLRECTRSQNCCNTPRQTGASGLAGAYLDKRTLKWYSHIQIGRHIKHLGTFTTAEEAHEAYRTAVDQYHGDFARTLERTE